MATRGIVDTLIHRGLRIPYGLNVHVFQNPKKPKATFVFLHGIGNTLHAWDEVIEKMPANVRLIGIDLLGFGQSPKPAWVVYNAKTQAKSVAFTLLRMRLGVRPIVVGHSLGALVAVELAKRYPLLVKRLVLCSPPFYKPEAEKSGLKAPEDWLRRIYRVAKQHPERLEKYSPTAVKLGLANKVLNITKDNVGSYIGALEASIINQTALQDVRTLKLPMTIFYGTLDPVVISRHITKLRKERGNVEVKRLSVGHEIKKVYGASLANYLSAELIQ